MTSEDFITTLFCGIDDAMRDVPKHPQAQLYPSEIVTIADHRVSYQTPAPSRGGLLPRSYGVRHSRVQLAGAVARLDA